MDRSPSKRSLMSNSPIIPQVEGPLTQTRLSLNNAIAGAKDCIVPHQTKLNETQILLEDASSLQSAANRFNEAVCNFNAKRNHKFLDQLVETNNSLESALGAFTDYTKAVNSTRSSTIKSVLKSSTTFLPTIVFWLFECLKPEIIKPIIVKPKVIIDPLATESWKIFQSLLDSSC